MIERERLEDKGIGDQMASLQQTHPPWERIQDGTLKRIEMCFSMDDGTLIWSQGSIKVVKDMSEKSIHGRRAVWQRARSVYIQGKDRETELELEYRQTP